MSTCSRCGTTFSCGMVDGVATEPCWCASLPALPSDALIPASADAAPMRCFCPDCLRAHIALLAIGKSTGE